MRARIRDALAALAAVLMVVFVRASPAWAAEAPAPSPAPAGHYPLKADLLYNFAKFVEWPAEAFYADNTPFRICVQGDDPFGPDLEPAPKKRVNGRSVVVQRGTGDDPLAGCHVVFIAVSEAPRLARALSRFGPGVLTVSDIPGFAERGGTIGFVMERERVRFEINTDAAQRAGLKISSKLLKLAKVVR